MKKYFLLIMLGVLFGTQSFAQNDEITKDEPKTIFGNVNSHGGFGALMVSYTTINSKEVLLMGARGGWIINHSFSIGIGGYGFSNDLLYNNITDTAGCYLEGGYGGIIIEPIFNWKSPVHVTFPILIGYGGAAYTSKDKYFYRDDNDSREEWHRRTIDSDGYFVFHPKVEVELNMLKWMRLAFDFGYRYTEDINLKNSSKNMLRGFTYGVSFKFGKF